jgi:hypothetical protein
MISQGSRFEDDRVQPASELQAVTKTMAEAVAERLTADTVIRELDLPMSPRSLLANRCEPAHKRRRSASLLRRRRILSSHRYVWCRQA